MSAKHEALPSVSGFTGDAVLRREDDRLLKGIACFIDDIPELAGTLHVAFVHSPHSHANILKIDTAAARQSPGVVDVITADTLGDVKPLAPNIPTPGLQPVARPVLALDRVRFAGELVALVVAKDRYLAEDAAELIEVEYEQLPAVVDVEQACAADASPLHAGTKDNVLFRSAFQSAGFESAFNGADLVVREQFRSARLATVSIETRGCIAAYDHGQDSLTLWTSTQIPHIVRTAVAEVLNFDEARLRVVAPDVGGGFGVKATLYPEEVIVAALAKRFRAPVKWIGDRREDLLNSTHARDYNYDVSMAFRSDGTLLAIKAIIRGNIGAYPSFPFGASAEAGGAAIFLPGPYRLAQYSFDTRAITTNTCPTGVYRGVAAPASFFATEALMDRAAEELSMDPAEIRLRNVLTAADLPYRNVVGINYDAGSYEESLRQALEKIGYDQFRSGQPKDRLKDGKYRGIGIACVTEHTGQGASRYRDRGLTRIPGYDSAVVRIEPNGKAVAMISQATQGQGHLTAYAQIVAKELGLRFKDVTILEGDTATCPYGSGTFASRGAVTGSGAAMRASAHVAGKLRRIAAHILETSPDEIEISEGMARIRGASQAAISVRELAAAAYSLSSQDLPTGESFGLEATDFYDPPEVSITNATHIAQVAVDPTTGLFQVERYVVSHDCGRVINPMLVAGQLHGGIMQGMGSVLCEHFRFDSDGQPITTSLMDYLLPTIADGFDIEIHHLENWSKTTEGGFKGVGEGGVIGAVPAIANALRDALMPFHAKINRLPVSPSEILKLLKPSSL